MLKLLLMLALLASLPAVAQSRRTTSPREQVHKPSIVFWKTSPKSVALLLRSVPQTDAVSASVEWTARDIPGSTRDTEAAINRENYMRDINLLADYAVELDRSLPSSHRQNTAHNRTRTTSP